MEHLEQETASFEDKVKAMSAKEIIMAMVEGLQNPTTDRIDMSTFGNIHDGLCYGCAATNAICRIAGKNFEYGLPNLLGTRARITDSIGSYAIVDRLERAIDYLRLGNIRKCNISLEGAGLSTIKFDEYNPPELPALLSSNYLENLQPYIDLANSQSE